MTGQVEMCVNPRLRSADSIGRHGLLFWNPSCRMQGEMLSFRTKRSQEAWLEEHNLKDTIERVSVAAANARIRRHYLHVCEGSDQCVLIDSAREGPMARIAPFRIGGRWYS